MSALKALVGQPAKRAVGTVCGRGGLRGALEELALIAVAPTTQPNATTIPPKACAGAGGGGEGGADEG